MKLISINSASIEDDALILNVTVQEFATAFDGDGGVIHTPMPPEEMPFVYRRSDFNGLSPQVGAYLDANKGDFPADVQRWIEGE